MTHRLRRRTATTIAIATIVGSAIFADTDTGGGRVRRDRPSRTSCRLRWMQKTTPRRLAFQNERSCLRV